MTKPEMTLPKLKDAVEGCRNCDLYKYALHAVFGEGPPFARAVLVGEQPGDEEDRKGRPFVGPAGRLLDRALQDADIRRSDVYITNAVKHFKFEERGKGGFITNRAHRRSWRASHGWKLRSP
jgi:DNA polymerase